VNKNVDKMCPSVQNLKKRVNYYMEITKYPFGYKFKNQFEKVEIIKFYSGVGIFHGIKEKKNYLIIDSRTLVDFLDPIKDKKTIDEIITVVKFDSIDEMNKYIGEKYGRDVEFSFRANSRES